MELVATMERMKSDQRKTSPEAKGDDRAVSSLHRAVNRTVETRDALALVIYLQDQLDERRILLSVREL